MWDALVIQRAAHSAKFCQKRWLSPSPGPSPKMARSERARTSPSPLSTIATAAIPSVVASTVASGGAVTGTDAPGEVHVKPCPGEGHPKVDQGCRPHLHRLGMRSHQHRTVDGLRRHSEFGRVAACLQGGCEHYAGQLPKGLGHVPSQPCHAQETNASQENGQPETAGGRAAKSLSDRVVDCCAEVSLGLIGGNNREGVRSHAPRGQ